MLEKGCLENEEDSNENSQGKKELNSSANELNVRMFSVIFIT